MCAHTNLCQSMFTFVCWSVNSYTKTQDFKNLCKLVCLLVCAEARNLMSRQVTWGHQSTKSYANACYCKTCIHWSTWMLCCSMKIVSWNIKMVVLKHKICKPLKFECANVWNHVQKHETTEICVKLEDLTVPMCKFSSLYAKFEIVHWGAK